LSGKTGRYRLRPDKDKVVLQVEEEGIFGPRQRFSSVRWRDATPEDMADLVQVEIKPVTVCASSS
jgi:hypothetical protein